YSEMSIDDCLQVYQVNRHINVWLLNRISLNDLARGGFHPELNRKFTLLELIGRMIKHDPNHLNQIERLKEQANA
ncbi:MAG: hypothetical protein AB1489_38995, partial [Acidobacteriota bacterium]